jgi:hypothetical protein
MSMSMRPQDQRVAILLSTFNGDAFLHAQLDSLLSQTHQDWVLYWRDDGSRDSTKAVLSGFSALAGQGRCVEVSGPPGNLGPAASFHALLREVSAGLMPDDAVAFADQDDVWLPNKLERGLRSLGGIAPDCPALYCARQVLVDSQLNRIGLSKLASHDGAFPAALTQNVATGCTVMLNSRAAQLVAASKPSTATQHDWWCYLLVTAAGGQLIQDPEPVILYRQHGGNAVGAPRSMAHRAVGVLKRGPQAFMGVLRQNVSALAAQPELMTARARAEVLLLQGALQGGLQRRLPALRLAGLVRQTWVETMVFRAWFILG